MKILYHHRIRSLDGQFVHIEEIVRQLTALGNEVEVVGPVAMESASFGSESKLLRTIRRLVPGALYELLELGYSLLDFLKLYAAVKRFRPDCIYERFNLFTPSGIWVRRLTGIPLLLEVNAPLAEERLQFGGLAMRRLARWSQRVTWNGADSVITVTEVLKMLIIDYGVPAERIEVMPNGVDTEEFRYRSEDREAVRRDLGLDDRFVIGFTGFVREWHRLDQVVDLLAEAEFHDAALLVVGDGPAVKDIVARACSVGTDDRVHVLGVVERDRVARHIAAFDVAIQPHVVEYASPLKLIEYLAMGRAIIAPDTPNIRELLADGRNGLLFEAGNKASLRRALLRLRSEPSLREALEDAAQRTIVERGLTWRRNAERTVAVAERLCRLPGVRDCGPRTGR